MTLIGPTPLDHEHPGRTVQPDRLRARKFSLAWKLPGNQQGPRTQSHQQLVASRRALSRTAASCSATRAGRGAAPRVTRGHRALDGQHLADLRRQLGADGGQLVVGQLLEPDAALLGGPHGRTGRLVRGPERNTLANQPFGDIGGQRVAGRGQRRHPLDVERQAARPVPPSPAAAAPAGPPSRTPAPCLPAGHGCRPAAGPSASPAARPGSRSAARTCRGPARRCRGSSSAA